MEGFRIKIERWHKFWAQSNLFPLNFRVVLFTLEIREFSVLGYLTSDRTRSLDFSPQARGWTHRSNNNLSIHQFNLLPANRNQAGLGHLCLPAFS